MNKEEAENIGRIHCPQGWEWAVWRNLGWHVCWKRGPISVYTSTAGGFHAMIAQHPDECGTGGRWSKMYADEFPLSSSTVLKAAANEVKRFQRYAWDQIRLLSAVERALR